MKPPELDLFERLKNVGARVPTAPSEGSAVEKTLQKTDEDFSTPVTLRNLFTHTETHPIVLDFALLKQFGPEWYGWETATVFQETGRVFQTQLSDHTRSKIQAIKTVHVVGLAWESWQVFEKIIQAFNNNVARWDVMQVPSLAQLYAGIDILNEMRQEEFSDEVKLYAASAILHEDVFFCPSPLDVFQAEVARPYWHCEDCGNEDSALFHDGVCDTCTHRFDPENGFSMLPNSEALAAGKGKNTKLMLRFDPDPIQQRWAQFETVATEKADLAETMVDVQVAKLLMARDYANIRRRQLAEQLLSLKSWLGAS